MLTVIGVIYAQSCDSLECVSFCDVTKVYERQRNLVLCCLCGTCFACFPKFDH